MGTPRKVLFVVVLALLALQVVLLILGSYSLLLTILIAALILVNYLLWHRDEAYFTGRDSEAMDPSGGPATSDKPQNSNP